MAVRACCENKVRVRRRRGALDTRGYKSTVTGSGCAHHLRVLLTHVPQLELLSVEQTTF